MEIALRIRFYVAAAVAPSVAAFACSEQPGDTVNWADDGGGASSTIDAGGMPSMRNDAQAPLLDGGATDAGGGDADPDQLAPWESGPCQATLGSFSGGDWPPACYPFYSPTSFWNTPIPANPAIAPNSSAILSFYSKNYSGFALLGTLNLGDPNSTNAYDHPLYFGKASDPIFTLHCTGASCNFEGKKIHIPVGAQYARGTDGHMGVVDQTDGVEYDMWQATDVPTSAGGTINCSTGGSSPFAGPGFAVGGATASSAALGAGTIRSEELIAGQINHVLFGVVPCCSGTAALPASYQGACDTQCAGNQGVELGQVFMLNMSDAEIDGLGKSSGATAILKAMAHYGFVDADENGYAVGLNAGSPTYERTSVGGSDPIVAWAQAQGLPSDGNGGYTLDYGSGIDWASKLVVLKP